MNKKSVLLSPFELEAVQKILEEDAPDLISQVRHLRVEKREHTGIGAYVYFGHDGHLEKVDGDNRTLGARAFAAIDGLTHGAGLVLYVDDGLVDMLEIVSHASEKMPDAITGVGSSVRFRPAPSSGTPS